MNTPSMFISGTREFTTYENHIPAPYLRKSFVLDDDITCASLLITGLGFYDLYLNGSRLNHGELLPYISAPDHLVYFNEYDLTPLLSKGENVLGVILGNGMQNAPGGKAWHFDEAPWRSAPKLGLIMHITMKDGRTIVIESDTSFKVSPSPITFDDLRSGERYDARLEQPGWNDRGFDDSGWTQALQAEYPKGMMKLSACEYIKPRYEMKPVQIQKLEDGDWLYSFAENAAGVTRLCIQGTQGQTVTLTHVELIKDGVPTSANISFFPKGYEQVIEYTCHGRGIETYQPRFTYHGFQHVVVHGITDDQATQDLLTYVVCNSDIAEMGSFTCSDATANALQAMTRRSTLANFYYFPTDCPHREKNGWTGDAALSAEHTLLNLAPEKSYVQWLEGIRAIQNDQGALPGIVPTSGWGFEWGNGPAWDSVLTFLPYFTFIYRGDRSILSDNADAIDRYVRYLKTKVNENGLIAFGLGDWCPPDRDAGDYKSPLEVTDTLTSITICDKAALIFDVLQMTERKNFALALANELRQLFRERLVDLETMTVAGQCQTSQAMAIFYGIFTAEEEQRAFDVLLTMIHAFDDHLDTGILGARVLFHVLSRFGRTDLAFRMIVRPDHPSYGHWVAEGWTSLWENFQGGCSYNHHFFGDISSWFIQSLVGIRFNPTGKSIDEVEIRPDFIDALSFAEGWHNAPLGKITVRWERAEGGITLNVTVPSGMRGNIILPKGYSFEDGANQMPVRTGDLSIKRHG